MPHMGGKELAERIGTMCPNTKLLFTSGYADNAVISDDMRNYDKTFLSKPFSPSMLTPKVRDVLNP